MRRAALFVFILASSVSSASSLAGVARAQVDEERLQLMRETTSYTDVPDAADGDDPFDANVRIGFSQRRIMGDIRRELTNASGVAAFEKIGSYRSTRNVLDIGAEIGVYHDLALTFRLPVILSDSYRIGGGPGDVLSMNDAGGTEALFSLPFRGPTRSGIDTANFGFMWGPLNQNRVHEVPSWVILGEIGVPIGARMRACNPSDTTTPCDPGISRGNLMAHLETRISRRHRYVEPFIGMGATIELPTKAQGQFMPTGHLNGYQHTIPPIIGDLTIGAAFIPWENLPRFQRFVIDTRVVASYVSNGHDYSPLYDALGSSHAPSLNSLNCEDGMANDPNLSMDVTCPAPLARVPFNGLTDTLAYGRFGGRLAIEVQAAKYVSFSIGSNIVYQMAHSITSADTCNANATMSGPPREISGNYPTGGMYTLRAVECVAGIYNPHYRPIIDEPGRRFELAGSLMIDLFARATAQF